MSAVTISVDELPGRLSEALELARSGTEIVVQDESGPVAKLVPAAAASTSPPSGKREWVFNLHPGAMVMREDFDDYVDEEAFLRGDI